ncbi:unnamed protein product [Larinioides sclopetarius]|uniref:GrpE protein homolog n=1 Tax=Larinioides sclopetarius TaxID=280406 RepID=A0AAV1ZNS2_9ARAC
MFALKKRSEVLGRIDTQLAKQLHVQQNYWLEDLKRIVTTVKLLANLGIAFRGHRENVDSKRKGKSVYLIPKSLVYTVHLRILGLCQCLFEEFSPVKVFRSKRTGPEGVKKLGSNRLSSTSAAASDPSAEKATTTEGEQSNQNGKNEVSSKEKELLQEKEKLLEDVKNLNDKYMRALADNENIRNRMRREINDAKQYGIQGFVKDLVEVADVLGKATESVPKEALESDNLHLKGLFQGLQMTEAQLLSVFKRHGVTKVNPIGEKFNPNLHEALFEQVDASKEPGTVGTVTKVGYRLHDRVVRPAMVGVVKAPS